MLAFRAMVIRSAGAIALVVGLIAAGCAPSPQTPETSGPVDRGPSRPNVLRVAANGDVSVFHDRLKPVSDNPAGPYVNAGLADVDDRGIVQPVLLERLPSQEDGSWIVNPDGTMRTLLTLRKDLKWQDGYALTAADFVFAYRVYRDKDMPLMTDVPERYMSAVVAMDERTIEVTWQRIYVEAGTPDSLFRGAAGETLTVEITASSDYPRSPVIISDFLRRAGIDARPVLSAEALDADAEYRASYPGATVESWTPGAYDRIWTGQLATPENGFRGRNRGSYSNPYLDGLVDRLNTTLDGRARDDIFVEMERFVSAEVAVGHLYYQVRPAVSLSALKGITGYPYTWNVSEWRFE